MEKFHHRLRQLRTEAGLTQAELAAHIKKSKSSINMWERGEREPGLVDLEKIADFFNVDMDYLMGKSSVRNMWEVLREVDPSFDIEDLQKHALRSIEIDRLVREEYGDDVNEVIFHYSALDDIDKAMIRGEMIQMLRAEKYTGNK